MRTNRMPENSRENQIKKIARQIGFSLVGIARAEPNPLSVRQFNRWLNGGNQGDMAYLERHREKRNDPSLLLKHTRSVISVAINYYQVAEKEQRTMRGVDRRGVFSIYVHGRDYHRVMNDMLSQLGREIKEICPQMESVSCADTKPVSDRSMALASGIGWLGKNTSVISREYGSWIFLGELITNLDLQEDSPLDTLCGKCTRCVDACPTGALDDPFAIDARKCVSYLTIEKRGAIPAELQTKIGENVYGCDRCQSVCPYNDIATASSVFDPSDRSQLIDMTVDELAKITDAVFRDMTQTSAIRRCKPEGLRRNAEIVRKNMQAQPARD